MTLHKNFLLTLLCLAALNQNAESTSIAEKAAAMKERRTALPAQTDAAHAIAQALEKAKATLAGTSAELNKTTADIVDSQEVHADQLNAFLEEARIKLDIINKENLIRESYINQIQTLRSRYESLLQTLLDKLKVLQLKALEDKETIERLTLERDMYMDELTDAIQIDLPKHPTSAATMGTQTDADATPTRNSSTSTGTPTHRPAATHHTPSPPAAVPLPPKETNALFNKFTSLSDWEKENSEYRAAMAKGQVPSLSAEKRHIYRCWVAARVIHTSQNDSSKDDKVKEMKRFMLGKHKATHLPELRSSNSCFQQSSEFIEIYKWMKAHNILFPAAKEQMNALSPPRTPAPSSSPQRPRVQNQDGTNLSSSPSPQSAGRDLIAGSQAAGSPSPVRPPGLYADLVPVKPFSPIRELSPEEQRALSLQELRLYNYHRNKAASPQQKTRSLRDPQERFNMH